MVRRPPPRRATLDREGKFQSEISEAEVPELTHIVCSPEDAGRRADLHRKQPCGGTRAGGCRCSYSCGAGLPSTPPRPPGTLRGPQCSKCAAWTSVSAAHGHVGEGDRRPQPRPTEPAPVVQEGPRGPVCTVGVRSTIKEEIPGLSQFNTGSEWKEMVLLQRSKVLIRILHIYWHI